ncbi:MAG TPA: serine/threonine-protein kinase [Polyangiaceae bacterium]
MASHATRDRPPYGPGDTFAGKYRIRRVLGEGGMAVVYAAVDTTCDRQVALKVLRPSAAAQRGLSGGRMQREAATSVKLHERTPHVVEVLTAGVTEDAQRLPYYVMERLRGTTLREGIENKRRAGQPIDIVEVVSPVIEIAMALSFAHQMGVVHRDVKPENVFMAEQRDGSYMVKLLDFGVAALLADEEGSGSGGGGAKRRAFSGSRQYAAPEQLDGQPPAPPCDAYAVGLVLYEMLTFTLPHDRMNRRLTVAETALNVLSAPIPDLKKARADVPPRLEVLVRGLLAYEPRDRPLMLQVAHALRDVKRLLVEGPAAGPADAAVTDVSGPPVEVLLQQLQSASADLPLGEVQRMIGPAPVDINASTDPVADEVHTAVAPADARVPADHEVFFMGRVADSTARLPALGDTMRIEPQPVVVLASSVQAPATLPLAPPQPAEKIHVSPAQERALVTPEMKPAQPPTWVPSYSVEPVAHTQPEPMPPTRRAPGRVAAVILGVAVAVGGVTAGVGVTSAFLRGAPAAPAAASSAFTVQSVAPAPSPAVPPAIIPAIAASSEPVASAEPPPTTSASASRPPVPPEPKHPPVAPAHPRAAPPSTSTLGERPSAGF